jgi:hypothetical protein
MVELRLPLGDFTSSVGKAAKHLLMTHFPGFQPIEEHHSSGRFYKNPPRRTETSLQRLSARTKCDVIDGFGIFKGAGEDGVFPGLLQHRI